MIIKDKHMVLYFAAIFCLVLSTLFAIGSKKHASTEPCVGHCPPPGPMDCTIYGRKKDGSWPSGFECSSTP